MSIPPKQLRKIIAEALIEDVGSGDVTTFFCVSPRRKTHAVILAKQRCVLCGMKVAREVFMTVDPSLRFRELKKDGQTVNNGERIAEVRGKAASILKGERLAINFMALLSGIATYTNQFVERTKGTKVRILDTRKTTPTLRALEKYAVRVGGGINHRKGLWDAILIKDNHLRVGDIIRDSLFNGEALAKIVKMIRDNTKLELEIEVENLEEFKKVISYRPDIILLDNFQAAAMKKAVLYRNRNFPRVKLEASGGVTLKTVRKIAQTGVDFISVGSITHSPESIDFSLEIDE